MLFIPIDAKPELFLVESLFGILEIIQIKEIFSNMV
jgi:hypothetical protein